MDKDQCFARLVELARRITIAPKETIENLLEEAERIELTLKLKHGLTSDEIESLLDEAMIDGKISMDTLIAFLKISAAFALGRAVFLSSIKNLRKQEREQECHTKKEFKITRVTRIGEKLSYASRSSCREMQSPRNWL